jgi:hypothetical protein
MGTISHTNDLMLDAAAPVVWIYRQDPGGDSWPIYSDGVPENRLQVKSVRHRCGGAVSSAQIELNLEDWSTWADGKPKVTKPEDYEEIAKVDDLILVTIPVVAGRKIEYYTIFMGTLSNPTVSIGSDSVGVQFMAFGLEQRLDDFYVAGRTCPSKVASDIGILSLGNIGGYDNESYAVLTFMDDTIGVDLPLIFNENGVGNRSMRKASLTSPGEDAENPVTEVEIYLFEGAANIDIGEDRRVTDSAYWTLSDAILYILWCYNMAGVYVKNPTQDELDGVFGDARIGEVNLSGCHTITECLLTLLRGTPYTFATTTTVIDENDELVTDPGELSTAQIRARLYFWNRHTGPLTQLQIPDPDNDTILTAFGADTTDLKMTRRTDQAAYTVTVQGDYKYHQGEFQWRSAYPSDWDFITAWKDDDGNISDYFEDDPGLGVKLITAKQAEFLERYTGGTPANLPYSDVFRSFALNETGEYYTHTTTLPEDPEDSVVTAPRYNQGLVMNSPHEKMYDFSFLFGHSHFVARRRSFLQTIEPKGGDISSGYYPPMLFLSFDNGVHWIQQTQVKWSKDECKFRITTNDLTKIENPDFPGVNYLQAFFSQTLRLRVVAGIQDDQAVRATSPPSGGTVTRFKKLGYRAEKGIKYQDAAIAQRVVSGGAVVETDHSELAMTKATVAQLMKQGGLLECNPILLGINMQYRPGMRITGVGGRDIDFGVAGVDGTVYPQVVGVKYVFGRGSKPKHSTTLELDISRG